MPEARAFWTVAEGRGEICPEPLTPPGVGEVLVRTLVSGISRGTETLVFQGLVPPSQRERMRAPFQAGAFPFQVKYGYSAVGVVEAGEAPWLGRRVFCLHPHQDRFVVPATAVHAVPDGVPDHRAVLAANLETAINALWDAPPLIGDRIAVVGAGVLGALIAALAAHTAGAEVTLIDIDPAKERIARALGVDFMPPGELEPGVDLVAHASASAAGLAEALRVAGDEATVLEVSWYGVRPVAAPLGEMFHSRRLTLRSSQVGAVPPSRRARWDHPRRLDLALRLLQDQRLDGLLEPAAPFEDLPEVMARLPGPVGRVMCQVMSYP